ncbi:MAG TPA: hypothetical protein VEF04_22470, partial [Blastocatellia bacterium]|nr:hypothetical protein [Blastocatellia bacterium]
MNILVDIDAIGHFLSRWDEFTKIEKILHRDIQTFADRFGTYEPGDEGLSLHLVGRSAIRAFFAYVEAWVYQLKQLVLTAPIEDKLLTVGEVQILKEQEYQLGDSGQLKLRPARLGLVPNFKFTLRIFARVFEVQREDPFTASGFESFKMLIVARDRLMHPKSLDDITNVMKDVGTLLDALNWFEIVVKDIYRAGGWNYANEAMRQPGTMNMFRGQPWQPKADG